MQKILFTGLIFYMQITPYNNRPSFKGYDARHIRALVMTSNKGKIAQEMKAIGDKSGFKVLLAGVEDLFESGFENVYERCPYTTAWAQDIASVTPDNKVYYPWSYDGLGWLLSQTKKIKGVLAQNHIAGGNYYIVKNGSKNDLIIGKTSMGGIDENVLKSRFCADNIHIIPQMDYHIDLGIRPLINKNVLVCNDDLMIASIEAGIEKTKDFKDVNLSLKKILSDFKNAVSQNIYEKPDKVAGMLTDYGYNPVPVPARIYDVKFKPDAKKAGLVYKMNFANAVALENANNELIYITNKSLLDRECGITPEIEKKTGFSFEKIFKSSIAPFVEEKNVHFVSGENDVIADYLTNMDAGIHCLCAEIP